MGNDHSDSCSQNKWPVYDYPLLWFV